MIDEFVSLRGYFKVEAIKDNKVIDVYEDHNFIMSPARISMAELFVGASKRRITKLRLGTSGFLKNPYTPITESNGFSKERNCLYCDSVKTTSMGQTVSVRTGEIIKIGNAYYQMTTKVGDPVSYRLTQNVLNTHFSVLEEPVYGVNLEANAYNDTVFPGTNDISKNPGKYNIFVAYTPETSTITYTFDVSTSFGNDQHQNPGYSLINEAGIFINNRLFCMKCFPSKLKDESTSLKITWKIMF